MSTLPKNGTRPAEKAIAPTRIKIKVIRINDFRAFAGPESYDIKLNSNNLLIYGENGSGKSSIFHALNEFFAIRGTGRSSRRKRFSKFKNQFSKVKVEDGFVEIIFDDNKPAAKWDSTSHPIDSVEASKDHPAKKSDSRVLGAAYQKAILDYRSLLDTNYRHGNGDVNLFDVCVQTLLRDYRALPYGQNERLISRWRVLTGSLNAGRLNKNNLTTIAQRASEFNSGIREALDALLPKANSILRDLGWNDVELTALFTPGVTYNNSKTKAGRAFDGRSITPEIKFRGLPIDAPQNFLNEARLSALALAIYFAGRQVCAETLRTDTPRLMVLDDVLIGLDQSNRLPVLQVLLQHFSDWQIVLLTHDRVWFEMARFHLADRGEWDTLELFEEIEPQGGSRPVMRPQNIDPVASNIATARKFHATHEYPASAVHARVAFEFSLKKLCNRKSVPVRFHLDQRQTSSDELLSAIEAWLKDPSRATQKVAVDPVIAQVKMWRKVVLNPFSHSTPVNLTASEVNGAIDAVEALHQALQIQVK